jgi:hypothetical protein
MGGTSISQWIIDIFSDLNLKHFKICFNTDNPTEMYLIKRSSRVCAVIGISVCHVCDVSGPENRRGDSKEDFYAFVRLSQQNQGDGQRPGSNRRKICRDEITLHFPWLASTQSIRTNTQLMELANSPRYSRLANETPVCNFGAWDQGEVECNNVRLNRCISRHEKGGVGGEMKNN